MRIIALELSSGRGSIAWVESDGKPLVHNFPNDRKHSGLFFETLQTVSRDFGTADRIVVGLGPGSYAGVRIAIAAALGFRVASASTLLGLPSICGMETAVREYCVIGDARRTSYFFGHVLDGRLVEGPSLYSGTELEKKLLRSNIPVFASERLSGFPQAELVYPSAGKLAVLGRTQLDGTVETQSLEPIYLREPHITVAKVSRSSLIRQ